MGKILFIAGQLNIEIICRERAEQTGLRRIIQDTSIDIGGRAFRQAIRGKELGMNVFLLGRLGDDDHGRMIREALAKAGISVRYVEESPGERTGLSVWIHAPGRRPMIFFDPGANLGPPTNKIPIDYYLHLCDAVIVNKWCNYEVRQEALRTALLHRIPSIYVHSGPPCREETTLPMDFLFLDLAEESPAALDGIDFAEYRINKAILVFTEHALEVRAPAGAVIHRCDLPEALDADWLAVRMVEAVSPDWTLREIVSYTGKLA